MPVRKADSSSGMRLWSPGVHKAMTPDRVMSAAARKREIPIYHVMTFQFIFLQLKCKGIALELIYQYKIFYICIDIFNRQKPYDPSATPLYHCYRRI